MNLVKQFKIALTRCVASGQLPGLHKCLIFFQSEEEYYYIFLFVLQIRSDASSTSFPLSNTSAIKEAVCDILTCLGQVDFRPHAGPWRSWWGVCSGRCEAAGWWESGSTPPKCSAWFLSTSGCPPTAALRTHKHDHISWTAEQWRPGKQKYPVTSMWVSRWWHFDIVGKKYAYVLCLVFVRTVKRTLKAYRTTTAHHLIYK